MEARAVGRYLRVTPRKARYVLDTVRGKSVKEALAVLKFVPNEAAKYIQKVIESAAANAEHNYAMDRDTLRIIRAFVDGGPSLKRIHPRAMGRAYRILKRTSHITVVVTEDDSLKQAPVKAKGRRTPGRKSTAQRAEAQTAITKEKTGKSAEEPKSEQAPGPEPVAEVTKPSEQEQTGQTSEMQLIQDESATSEQKDE